MHSKAHDITTVFFTRLAALATARNVGWLANPPLPLDRAEHASGRLLWCKPRGDLLIKQPGSHPEDRRLRMVVGVRTLTAAALADADVLHFAARDLIKGRPFRADLAALRSVGQIREVEIEPSLADIAVEGCLLMSAYEIDYLQFYPSLA